MGVFNLRQGTFDPINPINELAYCIIIKIIFAGVQLQYKDLHLLVEQQSK